MELHKPKPVHNWRELLSEIGVIVIGVCIALAAEQGMEWVHWRDRVAMARRAIASETAENLSYGILRLRRTACMEKSLDAVAQILDAASKSGTLPPMGEFGNPQNRVSLTGQWESLISSETASHFPPDELAGLTLLYHFVTSANDRILQEVDMIALLDTMAGPGRKFDPVSEARLREALSTERLVNRELANYGLRIWEIVARRGMKFSEADLRLIDDARREPVPCPIVGKPTANYGQAPWDFVPKDADEILKHPPRLEVDE